MKVQSFVPLTCRTFLLGCRLGVKAKTSIDERHAGAFFWNIHLVDISTVRTPQSPYTEVFCAPDRNTGYCMHR